MCREVDSVSSQLLVSTGGWMNPRSSPGTGPLVAEKTFAFIRGMGSGRGSPAGPSVPGRGQLQAARLGVMDWPKARQIKVAVHDEGAAVDPRDGGLVDGPSGTADVAATQGPVQEGAPSGPAPFSRRVEGRGGGRGRDGHLRGDVGGLRRLTIQMLLERYPADRLERLGVARGLERGQVEPAAADSIWAGGCTIGPGTV